MMEQVCSLCYQQEELLNIQKCETQWGAARDDGSYACLFHVMSCLYIYILISL